MRAAIIADDLTGALDSAAPFAALGLRVVVAMALEGLSFPCEADVVAVSLSSREIGEEEAVARAGAAAKAMAGVPWLFKKIDSRMKGHVRAEVAAIAAVRQPRRILACPAIPDLGRVVRDGALMGQGVQSPIALAPLFASLPVDCPDAVSLQALDALVAKEGPETLMVGARGLAAALARRLGQGPVPTPQLSGPLVMLVGSRDPITLEQVLQAREEDGVDWIAAPDGVLPTQGSLAPAVILQATPGGPGADGVTVAQRLAQGLPDHLAGRSGLVITGGETAGAVLAQLAIQRLEVLGEVMPGLPICRPLDFAPALTIVTKSGGFGDKDALQFLIRQAKGVRP